MVPDSDSIGSILVSALVYPLRGTRIRTLGIGGFLMALWAIFFLLGDPRWAFPIINWVFAVGAIVIAIPLTGYYVRVVRSTADDRITPPTFGRTGSLLLLGTKGLIVFIVFQRPETLEPFLSSLASIAPLSFVDDLLIDPSRRSLILPLVMLAYIYPAAIGTFVRTGSILSAFNPQRITPLLLDSDYIPKAIVATVISMVAMGVIFVIYLLVRSAPVRSSVSAQIGSRGLVLLLLLLPVLLFYVRMIQHYVIGRIWQNVDREKPDEEVHDTENEHAPLEELEPALRRLYERGLLTSEEYEVKRRALERIDRTPDLDVPELLKSLEELHERGVLTEEELAEKQRAVLANATDRPLDPHTIESDRTRRLEALDRLSASDVLTEDEYEAKRRELEDTTEVSRLKDGRREDHSEVDAGESIDREEPESDVTGKLEAIYHLHATGLLTDEEFEAKRRIVLGTVTVTDASTDGVNVDRERFEQFERLHRLHEQGVFTDDEYEAKKRELIEQF